MGGGSSVPVAPAQKPAPAPIINFTPPPVEKEPDVRLSFGKNIFTGKVAKKYLSKVGVSASAFESPPYSWTKSIAEADKVATAVKAWAMDMGATNFCHWFQPIGSSGLRHGQTGQVQLSMLTFDGSTVVEELKVCCLPYLIFDRISCIIIVLYHIHRERKSFLARPTVHLTCTVVCVLHTQRELIWQSSPPHQFSFGATRFSSLPRSLHTRATVSTKRHLCCVRTQPCLFKARACSSCLDSRASSRLVRSSVWNKSSFLFPVTNTTSVWIFSSRAGVCSAKMLRVARSCVTTTWHRLHPALLPLVFFAKCKRNATK